MSCHPIQLYCSECLASTERECLCIIECPDRPQASFDLTEFETCEALGQVFMPVGMKTSKEERVNWFNKDTPRGRRHALLWLYEHLTWPVFFELFKLIFDGRVEHPVTKQVVNLKQLSLHERIFCRFFKEGPEADDYFLWDKRYPEDYAHLMCKMCGEFRLVLRWALPAVPAPCSLNGSRCRHPHGNYHAHRAYSLMHGYCPCCLDIMRLNGLNLGFKTVWDQLY